MITMMLDIGSRCNLACEHCSSSSEPGGQPLAKKALSGALEHIRGGLVSGLHITGGEPLLLPQLPELLAECDAHGIPALINTNLTLSKPERWLKYRGTRFQVSLDGPTAESNDRVRGAGSYAKTLSNLRGIIDAGMGARVGLNYVCMRLNLGRAAEMTRFAAGLGLTLGLDDVWSAGRGTTLQLAPREFLEEVVSAASEARRLSYDGLRASLPEQAMRSLRKATGYPGFEIYRCHAAVTMAYLSPEGELRPCIKTPAAERVPEEESLSDAMLSDPFRDFRSSAFGERDALFGGHCANCEFRSNCTPCLYESERAPALCATSQRLNHVSE